MCYELYDASVLLLVLGLFGYVITDPPPATQEALAPLQFVTERQLGYMIVAAGAIGATFAYACKRLWILRLGYIVTVTASLIMSINFALGLLVMWLGPQETEWRLVISAFLYGWIASRLLRVSSE